MLILTRRLSESITIGEIGNVKIKILSINGNQVRLGITAPKELPVHREEIFQRISNEEKTKPKNLLVKK